MAAAHVLTILAVADLPRAARFYERVLGWHRTVDERVYVELSDPRGMRLGLYAREGFARNTGVQPVSTPSAATSCTELYLHVDDAEELARRAVTTGARLLSAAAPRPWGEVVAYVSDPDGNVLALACPAARDSLNDAATL